MSLDEGVGSCYICGHVFVGGSDGYATTSGSFDQEGFMPSESDPWFNYLCQECMDNCSALFYNLTTIGNGGKTSGKALELIMAIGLRLANDDSFKVAIELMLSDKGKSP